MSFLNVSGKIFICDMCNLMHKVEYEGGPQPTQIGDDNIFELLKLSEKLGQPNEDPEANGFYLYDYGICATCYKHNIYKANETSETAKNKIINCYNRLAAKKEEHLVSLAESFSVYFQHYIKHIQLADLEIIAGERIDKDLGDKHATPSKKKGKFNQLFHQKIKDKIIQFIIARFMKDDKTAKAIDQFNSSSGKNFAPLKALSMHNIVDAFIPFKIAKPENLNNYVQSEYTIRHPVKNTPDLTIYHPVQIDIKEMEKSLKIGTRDFEELLDEDTFIKACKSRLEEIILK
jgi:hypothetical protein